EDGLLELVADDDFVNLLAAGADKPHLLMLSACETAQRMQEDTHPFVGLGPRLIEAGIPAVVAMQELVPVKTAHELVRVFAAQLARHGLVDRALSEARLPLYSQENEAWSVPVLFMRTSTGRIALGNPVHEILQRIRASGVYARENLMLPLPIDVVHVLGMEDATNLRQLSQEQAAARKLLEAATEIFERHENQERRRRTLVMLVGERGSAKSTQLRELAQDAALFYEMDRPVLPVIIDLSNFPFAASAQGGPLQFLIFQTLAAIWPDLQANQFEAMLTGRSSLTFRFLFDGSDDLTAEQRFEAWQRVSLLATRYPHHEYLLASDPDHLDRRNLTRLRPTDMLVMQPLLQPQIKQFLEQSGTENDLKLLSHLQRHHLFDLVEIPWLMARIWGQAKEGTLPESRTTVLTDLVEEALSSIKWLPGMRTRARITLQALAWHMQEGQANLISVDEAFRVLRDVRGDRDYPLEGLFANLVNTELLARVGDDMVRFTNPQVQAYLCAREIAESEQWETILEDITATLGRLGRLRWWSATLVYLAGLLERPRILVDNIVYGVNLLQSEQIFLAVRCILEMTKGGTDVAAWSQIDGLADQIIDGLIWRLNRGNEPNIGRRIRIVEALGQMRHGNGVAYLSRLANLKLRRNSRGDLEYEPSYVRMAATVSLHRQMPEVARAVRSLAEEMSGDAPAYEMLADVLAAWHE
ncbi:MAG: CHAT domain-containing protein, partial [Anaerolineales bacterium]|nr:CHAT domain-containing protein [Anaerolineales bacterium]